MTAVTLVENPSRASVTARGTGPLSRAPGPVVSFADKARSTPTVTVTRPVPSGSMAVAVRTSSMRAPDHESSPIGRQMPLLAASMPQSQPKAYPGLRIWLKAWPACG